MQGRTGTRAGLVYLLAGAALGAAVVVVLWIVSGGRPFGEVVGTADVSPPTHAPVQQSDVQRRTGAPAPGRATLEKAPPSLGGSGQLQFKKPAAERRAKARRAARAERRTRRARERRRAAVRVAVPPPSEPAAEVPVAVVPSPAPATAPAPPAPAPSGGASEPVKRRAPSLSVGAGEG